MNTVAATTSLSVDNHPFVLAFVGKEARARAVRELLAGNVRECPVCKTSGVDHCDGEDDECAECLGSGYSWWPL